MNTPKPHEVGCKVCGDRTSRLSRGLCSTHYAQYRRRYKELGREARELYEAECIRDGWLLPIKKSGPAVENDVFGAIASKYDADEAAHIAEGAAELEAAGEEHARKKAKRPAKGGAGSSGARKKRSG